MRFAVHALSLFVSVAFVVPSRADEPAPLETYSTDQTGHWAFQPVRRPDPPAVSSGRAAWVRNPIDRFILADLESIAAAPSHEADKIALIRRATFDLTGLPPTPDETDAFVLDNRPDAYERLIDRLLASPRYGERWAQHWLDLAHYADTNGFELDVERPDSWRYRDWVIKALNDDMPYDRFLTLQLAGDEAEPGSPEGLIATGFNRCGPREVVGGNIDPDERRQSELTGVTGTVGSVFMGLTIGCARCHNHKFDPIPATDYYRLQAVFAGAEFVDRPIFAPAEEAARKAAEAAIEAKMKPIQEELAKLEKPYRDRLRASKDAMLTPQERAVQAIPADQRTPEQKKLAKGIDTTLTVHWEEVAEAFAHVPQDHETRESLKRRLHELKLQMPRPLPHAMAMVEDPAKKGVAAASHVLKRGNPKSRGAAVEPRPLGVILAAMSSANSAPAFEPIAAQPGGPTTMRRLSLARWLTRRDHPLTARVMVNRLWQSHFQRGLVATPSDFGAQGELPTHPDLLDWLASEFMAQGWRLKPLHRLMMTSSSYRQSSSASRLKPGPADDPENLLLWRMNRRRMEAESLRDAMFAVSGELNLKMGGRGVLAPIEKEIEDLIFSEQEEVDIWPEDPDPAERARRSIYLFRKRNVRYPMFDAFDAPDTQNACPKRQVSTHALQSLVMLNSDFAIGRARALAARLRRDVPGAALEPKIERAYRLCFARSPNSDESARAVGFLTEQSRSLQPALGAGPSAIDAAWTDFALALLNSNEFAYVP